MRIKINGEEVEVPEGATIKDLLPNEHLVVLVRRREGYEKKADVFKLKIGGGNLTVKLLNPELWRAIEAKVQGLEMAWRTKRVVAFGPFSCDLKCSKMEHEYEPGDVL